MVRSAVTEIVERVRQLPAGRSPILIAIDGRSGSGKSTVAAALADALDAAVIEGDDFYAGGTGLRGDSAESRASICIDWRRLRAVLEGVRTGRAVTYPRFDWDRFDGSFAPRMARVEPNRVVVVEGVYSGRRELADLMDLRVLLRTPEHVRLRRLTDREGVIGAWERQWHEAEDWYFSSAVVEDDFDLILDGS